MHISLVFFFWDTYANRTDQDHTQQSAASDQAINYLLIECSIKVKISIHPALKRKYTGSIDKWVKRTEWGTVDIKIRWSENIRGYESMCIILVSVLHILAGALF